MAAICSSASEMSSLKALDADVLVDVPGRHLPRDHAVPDGPGPRPHLGVGRQGHGRHLAGPVADHARFVEDGRDVPGERDVAGRAALRRRRRRQGQHGDGGREDRDRGNRPPPGCSSVSHGLALFPTVPVHVREPANPGGRPLARTNCRSRLPLVESLRKGRRDRQVRAMGQNAPSVSSDTVSPCCRAFQRERRPARPPAGGLDRRAESRSAGDRKPGSGRGAARQTRRRRGTPSCSGMPLYTGVDEGCASARAGRSVSRFERGYPCKGTRSAWISAGNVYVGETRKRPARAELHGGRSVTADQSIRSFHPGRSPFGAPGRAGTSRTT